MRHSKMKRGPWGPPTSLGRKQTEKAIHITLERKDDPEGGAENDREQSPTQGTLPAPQDRWN